jgi:hypothetical protein
MRDASNRTIAVRSAHRLGEASGILALSVLLDSALEHYRGSFKNPAMYTPLVVSALTLAVDAHGRSDTRPVTHKLRRGVHMTAALTGLVGTGFHLYNVLKRPGGLAWQNLFYGAPAAAPMAILLAGLLGTAAEEVRNTPRGRAPRVLGRSAGRFLGLVSGVGLIGTAGEAALLHFRGAYQNPFMVAPVTIPPLAGALLLHTVADRPTRHATLTKWWLRLTALLGFAGTGFHARGVHRNMGGWSNWRQNILNGPPLPAPPSFTGLALAGLAALSLLGDRKNG